MTGETSKNPSERMIERLEKRQARRFQVGRMETTYTRLGVPDPWTSAEGVSEGPFTFLSAAPYYAMLRRMYAADERREKRFSWLFSRTTGSTGTRFADIRLRPTTRRLASTEVGGGDLLLVRPETQQTPAVEPANEVAIQPRRERSERRRDRSVRVARAVRQIGLSRATPPAPRRAAPETVLFQREPAEKRGLRAVPARPAPAARPGRSRAERGAREMIASLEAVVRSIPYTREAARVSALVADLREAAPETWPARIREVVREIDLTSTEIAAEIEAALPDGLARPMTVAVSRSPSADEARPRGLRTVTSRSPMMRAMDNERAAKPRPAERVRTERLHGASTRSPRRVAQRRGASVRRAAQRLGGASASAAGASEGASDGPEPQPAAIELDRLTARGSLRRMTGASRSPVDEAAVIREAEKAAPEVQPAPAAASPRARLVARAPAIKAARGRAPASAHVAARLSTNAGDRWISSATRAPARRVPAAAVSLAATPQIEAPPVTRALRSVLERVLDRNDSTREVGLRPAFYQRLGLPAPTRVAPVAEETTTETRPARGLERLAQSRQARDARETRLQTRHGEPRMRAAVRPWPGEAQTAGARRPSVIAPDSMNLPAATPVSEAPTAATATATAPKTSARLARAVTPRPIARAIHAPVASAPRSTAPTRAEIATEPEVSAIPAPRAADRAGARLESVIASTSVTLRAIEKASGGRAAPEVVERVRAAIARIEAAPLARGQRAAAVRQAIRELGPAVRLAEIESASPEAASPVAVASSRTTNTRSNLGLRPILGSSPAMLAAQPETPVVAAEAAPEAAPRKTTRAAERRVEAQPARLAASPVARAVAAVPRPSPVAASRRAPSLAPRLSERRAAPSTAPAPQRAIEASEPSRPARASTARAMERLVAAEIEQIAATHAEDRGATPPSMRAASRSTLDRPSGQSLLPRITPTPTASASSVGVPASGAIRAAAPSRVIERARRIDAAPRPVGLGASPGQVLAQRLEPSAETTEIPASIPSSRERIDVAAGASAVRSVVRAAARAEVATSQPGSTLPAVTPRRAIEALRTRISREASFAPATLVAQPEPTAAPTDAPVAGREPSRRAAFYSAAPRTERGPTARAIPTRSARALPERAPVSAVSAPERAERLPELESRATARRPHVVQSVRALSRMSRSPVVASAAAHVMSEAPETQLSVLREVAARGPAAYARPERAEARRGSNRRLSVGAEGVFAQVSEPAPAPAAQEAAPRRAPALGRPLDWMGDRAAASPQGAVAPKPGAATPSRAERGVGVVDLLREARAVQELVRSLSRAPVGASRAARLGPVAAARLIESGASRAETVTPTDAARMTRKILGDAFQVLAAKTAESPEATPESALSRVAIRGERAIELTGPATRISRRVLGDVVSALAKAVAGAVEERVEAQASTPTTGRRVMRPLAGTAETTPAPSRTAQTAARRYVETPRRERRPTLDEVYAAPFRAGTEAEAEAEAKTGPARARPRDLGRTLGAVEDGNPAGELPIWAQRAAGGSRVSGSSGGLLETLARAKEPADVIRAIERGDSALRGPSKIPTPVLRLLDEIRAEAGQIADVEAKAALEGATGQTVNTVSQDRGTRARGARSTSRVYHGYTNLSPARTSVAVDGLGPDRLMKLVRRLQQLIFLADGQRDDALRQVRLAEDSAAARSEGQAAPSQSGDNRSKQVDIEALAHDVLDKVHEIQEARAQRRLDDPDNRSVWW